MFNFSSSFKYSGCGAFFVIAAFFLMIVFLGPYLFMVLWNYAVVESLTIAKPIDYWEAMGLAAMISLFWIRNGVNRKED